MRLCLPLLVLCCSMSVWAQSEPFYLGRPLAHPVIEGSQESGATLAFVRESGGVVGYACLCNAPGGVPEVLDNFGEATIESVFYANLDSDVQTLIVLSKAAGQYGLRGFRFNLHSGEYRRLETLQPVLDRIAKTQKKLNAALVVRELNKVPPYDYDYRLPKTNVPEFDALDPTGGALVGYFAWNGEPAPQGEPADGEHVGSYKKTFQQRDGRWLTLTYERAEQGEEAVGVAYRVSRMAWELDPKQFQGVEDGPFVVILGERLLAKGLMVRGKKSGNWVEYDESAGEEVGAYVDGSREGRWVVRGREGVSEGMFVNDMHEGRWTYSANDEDEEQSGFDTYKQDSLEGPAERVRDGKVLWRGEFLNDQKQGAWIEADGEGSYVAGVKDGAWRLNVAEGHVQTVTFVAGKKDGELREVDSAGVLRLLEHYRNGVLDGLRETYAANGKLTYSASYVAGQIKGRALTYTDDGSVLLHDISWLHGNREGPFLLYHSNGRPDIVAIYEADEPIGHFQQFHESGALAADKNFCHVVDGNYTRIKPCGLQRGYFDDGSVSYETDYLFGVEQSTIDFAKPGLKYREVLLGPDDRVTRNRYYPNGQLECSSPQQGYRLITVEGREYKDYSASKRQGEEICYYPTGVIKRRFNFKDDKLVGCYIGYDESGVQNFPPLEGCPPPKPVVFNFGE